MKPGRELDALIAEKVMDECLWEIWSVVDGVAKSAHPDGLSYKCQSRTQAESYASGFQWPVTIMEPNPAPYSTSIEAAWAVVEKLNLFEYRELAGGDGVWVITQGSNYGGDDYILVEGDSASHVICLAALKVVGYEF